jgi:predicted GNAT family acetyltransferase
VEIALAHDETAHRYRLVSGAQEIGFIEYDPIGATTLLVKHTEVAPAHEGEGHGSALVRGMLEDVRARGMNVIPICPYTMAFLRRHREYLDVVREDFRGAL